jgi:hypothetical protein
MNRLEGHFFPFQQKPDESSETSGQESIQVARDRAIRHIQDAARAINDAMPFVPENDLTKLNRS